MDADLESGGARPRRSPILLNKAPESEIMSWPTTLTERAAPYLLELSRGSPLKYRRLVRFPRGSTLASKEDLPESLRRSESRVDSSELQGNMPTPGSLFRG